MNELKQKRVELADEYWMSDLNDQQGWYSKKAIASKKHYRFIGILIIFLSATVSFIQLFSPGPNPIAIATTLIGLVIILLKNIEGIYMLDETWISYRSISEGMKRERRLFINLAGRYKELDDNIAYLKFVETTEKLIKNEHESWTSEVGKSSEIELPVNESGD